MSWSIECPFLSYLQFVFPVYSCWWSLPQNRKNLSGKTSLKIVSRNYKTLYSHSWGISQLLTAQDEREIFPMGGLFHKLSPQGFLYLALKPLVWTTNGGRIMDYMDQSSGPNWQFLCSQILFSKTNLSANLTHSLSRPSSFLGTEICSSACQH